jgi:hypothetical protein
MNRNEIKLLQKEWKRAKISNDYFKPLELPLEIPNHLIMSIRSTGKTTGILIMGLLMRKLFNSSVAYIRPFDSEITRKNTITLFSTIKDCNYIPAIFDDQWDSIVYDARKFYLYNSATDTRDSEPLLHLLSIDNHEEYKSTLNLPTCRLIIFDEFIHRNTRPDEFINYLDLLKTIIRNREDANIFMLGNTITRENLYFHELEIYKDVQKLKTNQLEIFHTELGTDIAALILDDPQRAKTQKVNKLYFGFQKASQHITGYGGIWSMKEYPMVPDFLNDGKKIIGNNVYVESHTRLCKINFYITESTLWAWVHWCTGEPHEDAAILTNEPLRDNRYYSDRDSAIFKIIERLQRSGHLFFGSNSVGEFFESFYNYKK